MDFGWSALLDGIVPRCHNAVASKNCKGGERSIRNADIRFTNVRCNKSGRLREREKAANTAVNLNKHLVCLKMLAKKGLYCWLLVAARAVAEVSPRSWLLLGKFVEHQPMHVSAVHDVQQLINGRASAYCGFGQAARQLSMSLICIKSIFRVSV